MIEGALWRKWVFFYIPLVLFLIFLLFPFYWMIITSFRPDGELYRPWNSVNYNPFWTWKPTLEHVEYLLEETLFGAWKRAPVPTVSYPTAPAASATTIYIVDKPGAAQSV